MDAAMRLADRLAHGGHYAGSHGSAIAAPAPGMGGPVLVFVVDRVRSLGSEEAHQTFDDEFFSFRRWTSGPRDAVVRFNTPSKQAGAAFGRSEISGNKFAGRLVALQHAVQPTVAPEWFLVGDPVLDHRAHRHVLGQDIALRREHRIIINSHGKRQRDGYDGVVTFPVALVRVHDHSGSILRNSANRRL